MIVISPDSAPQSAAARPVFPSPIALDPLDEELVRTIRSHGIYGEHIWNVLTEVAATQNPTSREGARARRRELWDRLKRLLRSKIVFRHRRSCVTASKLPTLPRQRRRYSRRRRSTARRAAPLKAGSTFQPSACCTPPTPEQRNPREAVGSNLMQERPPKEPEKTKSALSAEFVTQTARSLARLPRKAKRKWTGWIGKTHCWRNQPITLPTGRSAFIFGVLRKEVVFTFDEGRLLGGPFGGGGPLRWGVVPANQVKVVYNESARILGGLKKGTTEQPSEKKRLACIQNGKQPVAEGRRPRGRPRRSE